MNETRERATTDEIRVEVTVAAPIEHAFAVFTEQVDAWWPRAYGLGAAARTDLVLEPGEGGRWFERAADGTECDWGRVVVWEPPQHLVLSWQIAPGFVPENNLDRASRVDIRFAADGPERTVVTLVHDAFERHGAGWESMRDAVAAEGGWPGIMATYRALAS
jgi:uncharacterized protein YndB with AHSA1/START domain